MPILGLSDSSSIKPRFPYLGKLRKGGEREKKVVTKTGKEALVAGGDLDHFRFTSSDQGVLDAFFEAYGPTPRAITVFLPFATPAENFDTWCELWSASGLQHRCDGKTMSIWLEGDKYVRGSKACPGGHKDDDPKRDAIGRLNLIVPDLLKAGYVGYVTMETHSINDIVNISSTLEETYRQRGNNPLGLRGIQFVLRRVEESITTPGWGDRAGQRTRTNKWLVRLEPAVEWVSLQMALNSKQTMMLANGVETDDPEPEDDDETVDSEAKETTPSVAQPTQPAQPTKPTTARTETSTIPTMQDVTILGSNLWPGKWEQIKDMLLKQFNGDLVVAYAEMTKRKESIEAPARFYAHVQKNWPGMETIIEPLRKDLGSAWSNTSALCGIAKAFKTVNDNPTTSFTPQALVDIAMTECPEKEIPEEFR